MLRVFFFHRLFIANIVNMWNTIFSVYTPAYTSINVDGVQWDFKRNALPWATTTVSSVLVFFLNDMKNIQNSPPFGCIISSPWICLLNSKLVGPFFFLNWYSIRSYLVDAIKFMLDLCFTDKHTVKLIEIQLRLASWFRITRSHTHTSH